MAGLEARDRSWPDDDAGVFDLIVQFLGFLSTTAVNKLAGLTEEQARVTPLPTSPHMSLLGVLKHLTAVQREHIQRRIGGSDLPSLWRSDDHDFEFRVGADETIATVVAAFDDEWARSQATLATVDPAAPVLVQWRSENVGRVVVDVVQETARHVGHIDMLRELLDGTRGE
jgi:hypothetical protein